MTGRLIFASGPADAKVIIRLSSSWSTNANGYVQGGLVYEVHTDASGNFIFPTVSPGRYLVDWQEGSGFTTVLHQGTYNPIYIADVEPLRGTQLGDVQVGTNKPARRKATPGSCKADPWRRAERRI